MENDNRNQKINPTPICPTWDQWLLDIFNNDKETIIAVMTTFAVHFRDSIFSQVSPSQERPISPISEI
jgi:hypothetical protein